MKKLLVFLIFFSFVNGIKYSFLPVNTMLIWGIIGLVCVLCNLLTNTEKPNRRKLKYILFWTIPMFLATIPATVFNGTDFYYIRDMIFIPITYIFGAYFVAFIVDKTYDNSSLDTFLRLYILSILLQSLLSLMMITSSNIQDILMSLINYSDLQADKLTGAMGFRAIGFGIEFFAAAIIMSIGLIVCLTEIYDDNSKKQKIFYVLSFIFILCIGVILARTTLAGAIISLVVFAYVKVRKSTASIIKIMTLILFVFFILYILKDNIINLLLGIENNYLTFALEVFINIGEGHGLESKSTNVLLSMYNIMPDNLFTWIFGDGYYRNPNNPLFAYYKGIDVGYLRIIFATGILGLIAFLVSHFKILNKIQITNENKRIYIKISLILLILVFLLKGALTLLHIFALFSFAKSGKMLINKTNKD